MQSVQIKIHTTVVPVVKVAILHFSNLDCQPKNIDLWCKIDILRQKYLRKYKNPSDALPDLRPARNLYRAVGIEPTRNRPSSEALLRRVIKQKPLYQINSIVDVCNYCSLAFLLPIGLYDVDKIKGDITIRLGHEREEYQGIGKEIIHVSQRLTLTDNIGPFGNPSADSLRTAIDLKSNNILMVIFASKNYDRRKLEKQRDIAIHTMLQYHSQGKLISAEILN